ncbi:MAG TPA: formylglycine-generating enzyme family protein [Anaerolineae bacterium]|nr:formylglycine-generating enzyme family protein [Anaerolineae bacterium]
MMRFRVLILVGVLFLLVGCGGEEAEPVVEVEPTATLGVRGTVMVPTAASLSGAAGETGGETDGAAGDSGEVIGEPKLGAVAEFRLPNGMVAERVGVPAGSFTMGSAEGSDDEVPVHEVHVDDFWLDRTEVTNDMFAGFVADTGHVTTAEEKGESEVYADGWVVVGGAYWAAPEGPGSGIDGLGNEPVVHVSWDDAQAFCAWAGGRLPTEAEWEKGARGTKEVVWPWGNEFDDSRLNCGMEDCSGDGEMGIAAVGSYPNGASPFGALDMAGNVWEWTADWYAYNYYSESPSSNPLGPDSGEEKVVRGGGWEFDSNVTRTTYRGADGPMETYHNLGFRCVADGS